MTKSKKERKESVSEDDDSSSNSSESSSSAGERKRKQIGKSKQKSRSRKKSATVKTKKKSKQETSESEEESSDSTSSTSSSSSSSSSESETKSRQTNRKKQKGAREKVASKVKVVPPVRETSKVEISHERTHSKDHAERREPVRNEREHIVYRHSGGDAEDHRIKERSERHGDRRYSNERDIQGRERGRERELVGWRGSGGGDGEHQQTQGRWRNNFNNDNRGYDNGAVNNGREQRFMDRRCDRWEDRRNDRRDERRDERWENKRNERKDERRVERRDDRRDDRRNERREDRDRFDDRNTQRDSWNNRERLDQRRERSRSPKNSHDRGQKDRHRQSPQRERPQNKQRRRRDHSNGDNETYEWGKREDNDKRRKEPSIDPADKEKPNFALSGALTEDANKVNGVVVKYAEPPEARKPKRRWRLYPFKGETALPTLHIHRQSCFLVGRERKVVDLAVDHPSCSKQHAALQYRLVPFEREDGSTGKRVRLYLIDLDSANGTFLNNKKVDARKYYELMEKDVIKFGFSTREYVLLHENSKEDQEDDDVDVKKEKEDEPLEVLNP